MSEYLYIGRSIPRLNAPDSATGVTIYGPDVTLPRMIWGKILRSPHPHALIKSLDTRDAEMIEGVVAVVTRKDAPSEPHGPFTKDMLIFARDKVRYVGEPVAAVAAIDEAIAEEALKKIQVEYEELSAVFDPLRAMEADAPLIHSRLGGEPKEDNICHLTEISLGDVERGFAEAELIHEDTYRTQNVHQGYLEPTSAVAKVDPSGHITIWTTTQGIFWSRELLADALKEPVENITVIPTAVGGGFGGKGINVVEPIAVLLARKAGRPVKIVFDREEDFQGGRPRGQQIMKLRTGVKKDGTIVALEGTVYRNAGAYTFEEPPHIGVAAILARGPYYVPNIKVEAYSVFTNLVPPGSMRAPTGPQSTFAHELQMDALAERLGMDPYELRLKNAIHEGDPNPWEPLIGYVGFGERMPSIGFEETLRAAADQAQWGEVGLGPNQGRGIACGEWLTGASPPASACVMLHDDGTVLVLSGGIDLGGLNTVLAQMVAEELSIPIEKVQVSTGDTASSPYTVQTGGSRMTYTMGYAALKAARDLKEQLVKRAAAHLQVDRSRLRMADDRIYESTSPSNFLSIAELAQESFLKGGPLVGWGGAAGLPPSPIFCTQIVDVEVDRETGQVKVLRIVVAQDVGRAINLGMVEGQIEGGVVQGLGYALMEEYLYDENGQLLNPNFLDYKMPTAADIPPLDLVIIEKPSEVGPFGCKGVGEPPIMPTAAAIANAVYDAVGVRIKKLPLTPETVYWALEEARRSRG